MRVASGNSSLDVREELIELLEMVVGHLAKSEDVQWAAVFDRLDTTRLVAIQEAEYDAGWISSFVSAVNLMTDCVRRVVDREKVREATKALDVGPGWNRAFATLVRQGSRVRVGDVSSMGYSVINWELFLRLYSDSLSIPINDSAAQEEYWRKLQKGTQTLPLEPILLADPSGSNSSWVTDDRATAKKLQMTDNPTTDVYDALGLNWTGRTLGPTTHAVLFGCALHLRERAAGSLHCPNAVDGWENMFFVSRNVSAQPWPEHGSATAGLFDDAPNFPEAIHGPSGNGTAEVSVSISAVGDVLVGNRALECGNSVTERAMKRLRAAVEEAK
jgi:hypothetical protein